MDGGTNRGSKETAGWTITKKTNALRLVLFLARRSIRPLPPTVTHEREGGRAGENGVRLV